MTAEDDEQCWVVFHDTSNGWIHFVRAEEPGHHWTRAVLDGKVSDPDGSFLVYVNEPGGDEDVRISIRTHGDHHLPVVLHEDFDGFAFGSPTLAWGDIVRTMWWGNSPWGRRRPAAWKSRSVDPRDDQRWPYAPGEWLGRKSLS